MSATAPNGVHPWKLLAPWWRWARQKDEDGLDPRHTRPVFQKYDNPDFVNAFLADPQRSLQFFDQVDRVFTAEVSPAPPPLSTLFAGKRNRMFAPAPARVPMDARLSPTGVRKLFLETHQRFYLVVCELHCDRPGLPSASADEVCQTGLVVRRRRFLLPASARKEAVGLLRELTSLRAQLGQLDEKVPLRPFAADKRTRLLAKMRADGTLATERAKLTAQIGARHAQLLEWQQENGVVPLHEGWLQDPKREHLGSWEPVEETPLALHEASFPLYHLFPDPRDPDHDGQGKAIWFGLVPVGGSDVDARGTARFDDQSLYEVRCFVRRHDPACPRQDEAPDCCGEIVWSEPTEGYKLANQNDLLGTSQRAVTVQLPDLHELAAQAAALPFGKASPVRFVQPQGLNFDVSADGKPEGASVGGNQICFFAIPLITIVAYFLLNLFLPIVVFVFGLFFLLQLKLCIPPSFTIDAGLKAELDVAPPSFDFDADFDVTIGGQHLKTGAIFDQLKGVIDAAVASNHLDARVGAEFKAQYSSAALVGPIGGLNASAGAEFQARAGVDLNANVEFEPRVTAEVQLT